MSGGSRSGADGILVCMFTKRIALAATIASVALAGCGASTSTSSTSNGSGTAAAQVAGTTPTGTTPGGGMGGGGPRAAQVTGTAATKAGDAATAKYPGTVERVMEARSGDGYTVMVTADDGTMTMVAVSTAYEVTGVETPPAGGPPMGTTPTGTPAPTTPTSASSGTSTSST